MSDSVHECKQENILFELTKSSAALAKSVENIEKILDNGQKWRMILFSVFALGAIGVIVTVGKFIEKFTYIENELKKNTQVIKSIGEIRKDNNLSNV